MRALILVGLLAPLTARAAEVVVIGPPPAADELDAIRVQAGARRGPLQPIALRSAATDATAADAQALQALKQTLSEVRAYETKLDGELVIMADLQRALDGVTLVRSSAERDGVFAALAYQGFAVDRFFASDLAQDDRAAPFRTDLAGTVVVGPWADAAALEPDRELTPYEVAEAPARVAYDRLRGWLTRETLPASIVLASPLAAGTELWVDGRLAVPDASGVVKVLPGRHFVHVERDGHVLARWTPRLGPVGELRVELPLDEATFDAWQQAAADGRVEPAPDALRPAIAALGGEIWVVTPSRKGPQITAVRADGSVERVERTRTGAGAASSPSGPTWSVGVGVEGGWLYSGDFYLQAPTTTARTTSTVNAGVLAVDLQATAEIGLGRIGAGVDVATPFGPAQVALTGDEGALRPRPYAYVVGGVRYAAITAGFVFPYHPAVGAQVTIPVFKGLEVRATGMGGIPLALTRSDGSAYTTEPLVRVTAGLGWRFGPR